MASTGFGEAYALNDANIDRLVSEGIGAYALGKVANGTFYVSYVGRSDTNLNKRLKNHIGDYKAFKYGHYSTTQEAFEKECHLYHDFNPKELDNEIHPQRPAYTYYNCPVAGCFN